MWVAFAGKLLDVVSSRVIKSQELPKFVQRFSTSIIYGAGDFLKFTEITDYDKFSVTP